MYKWTKRYVIPCAVVGMVGFALPVQAFIKFPQKEGPIPFYGFNQTTSLVQQSVPCKWIGTVPSKGRSKHDKRTYDYICKGGTWGTVTLLLDEKQDDKLGAVKLVWRAWDPAVHPAGGEAHTAAAFLDFFIHYFVPQRLAEEVKTNFWQPKGKTWRTQLVRVQHHVTQKEGYSLHELLVTGTGNTVPEGAYIPQAKPETPVEIKQPPIQTREVVTPGVIPPPQKPILAPPQPKPEPAIPVEVLTPKPVVPVKPVPVKPQVKPKPAPKPVFKPKQPIPPVRQTPEATIRWQGDVLEINGLSNGKRAINTGVFDAKEGRVFEVLRGPESFLRVQPPPLTGAYDESRGLTEDLTKTVEERGDTLREEVEKLILESEQVGTILEDGNSSFNQQTIEDILNAPIPQTGLPPEEDDGKL